MDSTNLCSICQNYGHRVSKCPELGPNSPPPSGGGGGSHSHDDDERAAIYINYWILASAEVKYPL